MSKSSKITPTNITKKVTTTTKKTSTVPTKKKQPNKKKKTTTTKKKTKAPTPPAGYTYPNPTKLLPKKGVSSKTKPFIDNRKLNQTTLTQKEFEYLDPVEYKKQKALEGKMTIVDLLDDTTDDDNCSHNSVISLLSSSSSDNSTILEFLSYQKAKEAKRMKLAQAAMDREECCIVKTVRPSVPASNQFPLPQYSNSFTGSASSSLPSRSYVTAPPKAVRDKQSIITTSSSLASVSSDLTSDFGIRINPNEKCKYCNNPIDKCHNKIFGRFCNLEVYEYCESAIDPGPSLFAMQKVFLQAYNSALRFKTVEKKDKLDPVRYGIPGCMKRSSFVRAKEILDSFVKTYNEKKSKAPGASMVSDSQPSQNGGKKNNHKKRKNRALHSATGRRGGGKKITKMSGGGWMDKLNGRSSGFDF